MAEFFAAMRQLGRAGHAGGLRRGRLGQPQDRQGAVQSPLMGSIFTIVFLSCFGVPYADYKSSAQPVSWLDARHSQPGDPAV